MCCGALAGNNRWRTFHLNTSSVQILFNTDWRLVGWLGAIKIPNSMMSRHIFNGFLQRLNQLGLLGFCLAPSVEQVGICFMRKKGDKLCMILDCRQSNCHFSDPVPIELATGEAMSRIHLEPIQPLYAASADLQNAFYTMQMPESLKFFLGLRRVKASQVAVQEVGARWCPPNYKWVIIP